MNCLVNSLKRGSLAVVLSLFYSGTLVAANPQYLGIKRPVVIAQTGSLNPLENTQADPLLPHPSVKRPLSPLEKRRIRKATVELDTQAKTRLEAGNEDEAFALWYRELRLQRVLGRLEEIAALTKVGALAWEKNRSADLKVITQRLVKIEQQATAEAELSPKLLSSLGQAYQQLRELDRAINIYQQLLTDARQRDDANNELATLETLGKLYLAKFDYLQAATIYEELLSSLPTEQQETVNNRESKTETYLRQLIEIYNQALQPDKALPLKQQLAEKYLENQQIEQLAPLKLAIADDYRAIKQLQKASQNYQEAYTLALSLQQFALARDALQKLAELHHVSHQPEQALQTYQKLLVVNQNSYDYYGLMNTYDRMGQIYWEQANYPLALTAYEKGLTVAQSLNYRVDYFTTQVDKVKEQMTQSSANSG
ncbi:tetratricopeptide repeat protein [Pleurocapsales cyanobacterium LEGE 06147]|nr:tetratricopeptide repeat protein [Pleurocapsales cyanobacterium LEGE 06147]